MSFFTFVFLGGKKGRGKTTTKNYGNFSVTKKHSMTDREAVKGFNKWLKKHPQKK